MFPGAAVEAERMPVAGSCSPVAPAGTDQLDLEAAEQLIQLSGGDGADDDDAGSESRSADSVKCVGRKKKEINKGTVVESRRRSAGRVPAAGKKDGNCGDGESSDIIKGVDSFACSATAADVVVVKDKAVVVESCRRTASGKDHRDAGILHGEARKRPRYRSLAAVYADTEPRRLTAGGGEGHADRDPPEEDERKEKKKRADQASKPRRSVQR